MRIVGSIILTLLTIPLFLIGLLVFTLKFQLLESKFWESAFEKNNTYASLTNVLKKSIEQETIKEGGSVSEIKLITDLATTENVGDFINRNLENVLNYANGKVNDLLVYIPISRTPKGFLPATFANLPEMMPLTALLTKLKVVGFTPEQIQYISLLGVGGTYLLILDLALVVIFLIFLLLLVKKGSRFIAPGLAFIFTGVIVVGVSIAGMVIKTQMMKDLVLRSSVAEVILGTVAPPIMSEILRVWIIVGIAAILAGIILFFVKKPQKA